MRPIPRATQRQLPNRIRLGAESRHSRIAKAIHQRLLPILPIIRVIELRRVEHDLVHNLRDTHRMRARTLVAGERTARCICHMALVVWAIEILPVPARGEDDGSADAARARLGGQLLGVLGVAGRAVAAHCFVACREAAVADGFERALGADRRVAGEHAEALRGVSVWLGRLALTG